MSRSGYSDELDRGILNLWRANVDRTLTSKRGQAFLKEMIVALDAIPDKRLIAHDLERKPQMGPLIAEAFVLACGVCAIGSVGLWAVTTTAAPSRRAVARQRKSLPKTTAMRRTSRSRPPTRLRSRPISTSAANSSPRPISGAHPSPRPSAPPYVRSSPMTKVSPTSPK